MIQSPTADETHTVGRKPGTNTDPDSINATFGLVDSTTALEDSLNISSSELFSDIKQ